MKVAVVAPPYLSVPPSGYGGTERIVSLLTEGLVEKGHDVTLFASGDSQTKAKLVSIFPKALGNSGLQKGSALLPLLQYRECLIRQNDFDIIHNHSQYLGLFMFENAKPKVVHTWHGSFYQDETTEEKRTVLQKFKNSNFISISNNQREALPELNYIQTVYNSLDVSDYSFVESPKNSYLLWLGRITSKKGPLEAIKVAKELNMPLTISGTIDPIDQEYFDSVIKPELNTKLITFYPELKNIEDVRKLYQDALCTLYPISWHEPFGLVMIESMACGTPVVAYDIGSVPEIVTNEKTGFVVDSALGVVGLVDAVRKISQIKRQDCRQEVETRFSKERMTEDYIQAYQKVLGI
jgi:glycosyltransferase involved in cell wall biosynthesis